jgi:hypothetical protein
MEKRYGLNSHYPVRSVVLFPNVFMNPGLLKMSAVSNTALTGVSWKRGIPHLYTEAPEGKISVSYGEEGSAWEGPFTLAKGRADVTKGTSLCCCTWDQSNIRMFCQDRNNALTVWAWKERQDWILDGYV